MTKKLRKLLELSGQPPPKIVDHEDHFTVLPSEMVAHIFRFLDPYTIHTAVASTCKTFHEISKRFPKAEIVRLLPSGSPGLQDLDPEETFWLEIQTPYTKELEDSLPTSGKICSSNIKSY